MTLQRRWLTVAMAAVVAGAALTVPFRGLWDPDEARYAEVTREMLASGMLVPLLYDQPYTHKPPLYFWALAAARSFGAPWTAAAVLPPLLAMLATLLLLSRMSRQLGLGEGTGHLAAALLASTPFAAGMALTGRMDMLLAAFHTGALAALARLLGVAGPPPRGRGAHLAFWTLVALGVLTKGPVALALPLLLAAALWLVTRPRVPLRPLLAGPGPLLALGIVLAWLVPAGLAGGREYLTDLLVRQTAGRVVPGSFGHPEPFYYHLVTYPVAALPWSPLVIVAAVAALRRRERGPTLFLALGVVSTVLLFSLVSGKLVLYLLPMYPIAALLAADHLARGGAWSRGCLLGGALAALALGVATASVPLWRPGLVAPAWMAAAAGAGLAVPAAVAVALALRSRVPDRAALSALVATGLAFVVVTVPLGARLLDPSMSIAATARAVVGAEPLAADGLIYRRPYPGLWLYAERPFTVLETAEELAGALAAGRWVLVQQRDLDELPAEVQVLIGDRRPLPYRWKGMQLVRGRVPAVAR